uniref:type I 3-dehydroquinate dehydratase n=1 Tax=Butyribacter sp. TaxID=2822465 RepID=UPI004025A7AD
MYTLEFDTEIPKICIPIVGTKEEEIIKTAEELVAAKVDLIEWRADYCSCILEDERLCLFLQKLRRSTGSIPLLFTIRTTAEGGELTISFEQYIHTLQVAAQSECVDYIDVEMFWWDRALSESESVTEGTIREAVQALQQHVQVIGSYHDFQGTPQEM